MTDNISSRPIARIAKARAKRPKVDNQGRRIGPAATFVYDDNGLLVSATTEDE